MDQRIARCVQIGRQESIAEFNLVDLDLKMAFGALATCRWTQDLVFKLDNVIQLELLVFLSFTLKNMTDCCASLYVKVRFRPGI